ncbi:MAG: transcriptional regulator CynR [Rhodomicrobium sp.]
MAKNLVFPRSLHYFIAVAEHRNFTRASEVLYVSQPTLSQQIKQLEDLLGVQLLDRTAKGVRLTAAGEVYLHYARRALIELDTGTRAIQELQDLRRGLLRLGMTPITDYLATPLLDLFNVRYPEINVSMLEMPQNSIEAALAEDRIDIGIVFGGIQFEESNATDINSQALFVEKLNFVVGKEHRRAGQQQELTAQELGQEPLVLFNTDYALRRHIDFYCTEHGLTPPVAIQASSLSAIIEVVRLGRFATILPATIVCAQHGLHAIALSPELPPHTITMICRKGAYKSPACLAFAELAAEWSSFRCPMPSCDRLSPCPLSNACMKDKRILDAEKAFKETHYGIAGNKNELQKTHRDKNARLS